MTAGVRYLRSKAPYKRPTRSTANFAWWESRLFEKPEMSCDRNSTATGARLTQHNKSRGTQSMRTGEGNPIANRVRSAALLPIDELRADSRRYAVGERSDEGKEFHHASLQNIDGGGWAYGSGRSSFVAASLGRERTRNKGRRGGIDGIYDYGSRSADCHSEECEPICAGAP